MEDDIYKINNLSINHPKTEFCFCYNSGMKTFNIENFDLKYNSNNSVIKLGDISLSILLTRDNTVIFVGSKHNRDYPKNKIVFYDIANKKEIFSKSFENEITNIKYVDKYIFICFTFELKIFSFLNENEYNLKDIDVFPLDKNYSDLFEVWESKERNNLMARIYLSYPYDSELIISYFTLNDFSFVAKINIASPVNSIQNLFYIKKLNQIFISDENGIYLYGFNIDDGKPKICLKRGSSPGIITSMTLLNNNFLAINNVDRTIHIFDLDINHNAFSFSNLAYRFVNSMEEIYPCLRIYYKDLKEEEGWELYNNSFSKKGAILISEDEGNELNILAYNGFAYKIRIDFKEKKYEVIKKSQYSKANNILFKDGKKKNISLYKSHNEFSEFNENEKK
jgi:hypothetical protein